MVRDASGTVVASAPKAEVGVAGRLLTGSFQADRLSLIGAEMALRVAARRAHRDLRRHREIRRGADDGSARQQWRQSGGGGAGRRPRWRRSRSRTTRSPALLAWIDKLNSLGLDGGALAEIGLKDCTLVVEDQRSGKRWTFDHINMSLTRPRDGGVAFAVNSTGADGLWSIIATVTPQARRPPHRSRRWYATSRRRT